FQEGMVHERNDIFVSRFGSRVDDKQSSSLGYILNQRIHFQGIADIVRNTSGNYVSNFLPSGDFRYASPIHIDGQRTKLLPKVRFGQHARVVRSMSHRYKGSDGLGINYVSTCRESSAVRVDQDKQGQKKGIPCQATDTRFLVAVAQQ